MELSKKINIRLTTIILTLISILIIINITLIEFTSIKASEFTGNAYYNQILSSIDNYSHILKTTTERVASNEKIIKILNENRSVDMLKESDKILMQNQIELFEEILKPITFIQTINVVSLQGEYLFSNGTLYENFDIKQRPWFKLEYLNNSNDSIITDVHKDFTTGKYAVAVVKFIYSEDTNELLGLTILDIFIQDLLGYIENGFYLGSLNSYVDTGNYNYLTSTNLLTPAFKPNNALLIYSSKIFDNKIDIVFAFDRDSIIYNKQMHKINIAITIILIIVAIILSLTLLRYLRLIFKPIINSLDKLKILFKNLEKNNFDLELTDEFEQLEFISQTLSKSFDKKIQSLIYYDELTKLPNRKMLFNLSSSLINSEIPFALIFIDLNNFKSVNDILGHSAGDDLLASFSNKLNAIFENKGIVTRYSGDEFVIIYDTYTTDEELINFYNTTVLNAFSTPLSFSTSNIIINFSGGASVYPRDAKTFDALISKSDFMMYNNKKIRDSYDLLVFNNDIYNKLKRIDDIKFELKHAITKNEFSLYYQPIVNKDKSIEKVEALIRWKNEKLGSVSPVDFICYAEEIGEIIPIGYWIIEEVCKNFNNFYNNNIPLQISINVSPIQLMDFEFVDNVKNIINKYNVDFKNLCFEITESVVLDDNIIVYDNIHLLHKLGISIALDDFGTGYAAFSYLRKYKLDILKIDKMFINNTTTQDNSFKIIENIKNIAHVLNMKVVIEGVETKKQFNKLSEVGCDYFQGYYFSKPITLDELKLLL